MSDARHFAEDGARRLGFRVMESRNSDRLDFKEVSIVSLLRELETAYEIGHRAGVTHAATTLMTMADAPTGDAT